MSAAGDLLRASDRTADDAIADMQALRVRVQREIRRQLRRIGTDEDGRIDARAQVRNLTAVRAAVLNALQELGAQVTTTIAERRTAQAARRAVDVLRRILPASDPLFAEQFMPNPDAMVREALAGFPGIISQTFGLAVADVRRAVQAGVVGQMVLDDLIAEIAARVGTTFSRAETAVETAVMAVGRQAATSAVSRVNERLGRDFFVLRYVGPVDKLTRPFCRHLLTETSRVFTEDAVAALDNGQGLPVRVSCGGYRCRHIWAPVTAAQATKQGRAVNDADDAVAINEAWPR